VLGPYRPLFATADARRVVAASLAGRLGMGAFGLPALLAVEDATGSFATAGVATGAFSLGVAVASPIRGRLIDRHGARAALPPMVAIAGAALLLIAALPGAPGWVYVALNALAGFTFPSIVAATRLEWQRILGEGSPRLAQAYAFESGAQTAVFVVGPMLAGAGIALLGSRVTLAASAVLLIAGTLVFAAVARAPASGRSPLSASPIRRPGVLTLVLSIGLADAGMGGIDVAVPALLSDQGREGLAGIVLAAFAFSAVVGALVYGRRTWPMPMATQLVLIAVASCVATAACAAPATIPLLVFVLLLGGAPTAAQYAAASVALDRAAGGRAGAEAFTWLSTANGVGIAMGSAIAGFASEHWSTDAAFLIAAIGPGLAAVLLLARRATLA
jgi:MFS family permease